MVYTRSRFKLALPRPLRRAAGPGGFAVLLGLLLHASAADAKLDDELLRLQRAAVARAGLAEAATARLLAREHLAALLPQVRVTMGQGWQITATGRVLDGLTAPAPDNDHVNYAVSAGWDLTRLLAPREAAQVHHEEPKRARQRLAVQVRVARLVATRCRLLQLEAPSAGQQERVAELEAALDLMTGGLPLPAVSLTTNCPAAPRFSLAPRRPAAAAPTDDAAYRGAAPESALDFDDSEPYLDE